MLSPLATGISAGLGALAGAGLAFGGCAYAAMWPTSRIFGRALTATRAGELALTFDDGPNPTWTPRLLEVLAEHGVHATFFMVGGRAKGQPGLVRQMVAAGHAVGNHSWSHPNLAVTAAKQVREELMRTSATLEEITGAAVKLFRPPFGGRRPAVLRIARELGLTPVLWNAMTTDWKEPSAERIYERLAAKIDGHDRRGRGSVVVMHDGDHMNLAANRAPSVAAAGKLLEKYASERRFVKLGG